MKSTTVKLYIRQLLLLIRQYSFMPSRCKAAPAIIIMFDNQMLHGGLLDRIKGIISAKLIADELQYRFGIYADDTSFDLFKFLKPQDALIRVDKTELEYNVWCSSPIVFYNIFRLNKTTLHRLFTKTKQYHFYCNTDLLRSFYPHLSQQDLHIKWRAYFNQLFYFDNAIQTVYQQLFLTDKVIGIHLRFQALLGDTGEKGLSLDEKARMQLIKACVHAIENIIADNSMHQVLIVSDSSFFIDSLKNSIDIQAAGIVIAHGTIGHIDFVHTEDALQKAITDFYLLSKCKAIYQVLAPHMYNSQFSRYAAILANVDYHLIRVS